MKKILLFTAGFAALGYVIYRYVIIQTSLLKDFSYKIIGIQVHSLTKTNLAFTLKIRFTNQSSIEATVSKLYSDVYLDGKNVGFITESKSFVIPGNGSSDVDIYFSLQIGDFLQNIVGLVLGAVQNKDIILSLRGTAKVSSGFITTTIPISYDTSLKKYL
jgi:LEA14-like dessication related protein